MKQLDRECSEILRELIVKHGFLQPASREFDVWNSDDASEVVADLIEAIKYSEIIETAHNENDWGK